jgi:hypothetical protein
MGMCVIIKDGRELNGMDLSTGKILEESWFSLLSTTHWEMNSPFSRTIT